MQLSVVHLVTIPSMPSRQGQVVGESAEKWQTSPLQTKPHTVHPTQLCGHIGGITGLPMLPRGNNMCTPWGTGGLVVHMDYDGTPLKWGPCGPCTSRNALILLSGSIHIVSWALGLESLEAWWSCSQVACTVIFDCFPLPKKHWEVSARWTMQACFSTWKSIVSLQGLQHS